MPSWHGIRPLDARKPLYNKRPEDMDWYSEEMGNGGRLIKRMSL